MGQRYYIETLGCPKNQVDSDKIAGTLIADGLTSTDDPSKADVVIVNTCAFIEEARKESGSRQADGCCRCAFGNAARAISLSCRR
jgi:tRNA A37 methylthiotransferase MiaB